MTTIADKLATLNALRAISGKAPLAGWKNSMAELNAISLGQLVWFEVVAKSAGVELREWRPFTIVGMRIDSSTDGVFPVYELSRDPPSAWYYGTVHVGNVRGDKLRVEEPSHDQ